MKAAVPPSFCTSAMTCSVRVVLPDDSGPYISTTRPRGRPPTPSARSRPSDPVDTTSMSLIASASIFMIEPLPNCFSIWESAAANALDLLSSISSVPLLGRHLRQVFVVLGQHRILYKRP